ncbi:MAG: VacB/RNase II family 3'-5' exoribonuclease, partial [Lentisphaeria bacterium]|nr:VacB/RNase II family 3'-5' exoribonuclease [Lentisphaeria bacterium]
AKDFDDALSIELLEDGVAEVGVHIADVAVHVPAGSDLDRWAFERGFTHYLPGRTLHMLPRSLAAERCSLREGEESLAHSVFLTLDLETGEVRGCRRAHTSIRVDKRLSFDDVSEFLANDRRPTADQSVHDTLAALARVAGTLRRRREEKEAFLALHMPEIRVLCSESPPRVHGLKRVEPNPAHELVEEFMLLANTAVARELGALQMPGVFRVHEEPRPADMEEFAEWAGQALGRKPGRLDDRHRLNAFLASLEQAPLRQVVLSTFLRALPRAAYSAADAGHYGLGKANYCHFTSPIRRYPDLLVHQQLLARDLGRSPRSLEACARVAEHTSSTQENADRAYFAASDRLKAMYLKQLREQDPGRLHQGVIGKVSGSGLLVYLDEFGLYGHLDAKRLGEGRFRKDRRTHALRDARSGKIYKCGDVIHVHILRADPARGEVHLEPARSVF